ncbi:MAG: N-formylglutamate amidohydrolase [Bdellovibrionaceae bacterium]|nr:N-formylglutamate amidohydrolase [Pseudobdellovibrionaceae bacterium]
MVIYHNSDHERELPFFVTIPHSGEFVPPEATWLKGLLEPHLMRDVDRFVDKLYEPTLQNMQISYIRAECHRYVIDLNRKPDEYDAAAVQGAALTAGTFPKGLHWCVTTIGEPLITTPMSMEQHEHFVRLYYEPFHSEVKKLAGRFTQTPIYHLDAHSMPSKGTKAHNDPGEERADIVVSDFHGKSCRKEFVELVIEAYKAQGFRVAYNWPYVGGGITQMYGHPEKNHHTLQVELNRKTYMNEDTKKMTDQFAETQARIARALEQVAHDLRLLVDSPR